MTAILEGAGSRLSQVNVGRVPQSAATAVQLLTRLPATLSGAARQVAPGGKEVTWPDGSQVTAAPLSEAAPGKNMTDFFSEFVNSGQFTVTAQSRAGSRLLWFVGTSTEDPRTLVAAVADANGTWMYGVEGQGPSFTTLTDSLATNLG